MEKIAQNEILITKKLFYEGMQAASGIEYRKTAQKAIIAFAVLWFVMLIFSIWQNLSFIVLIGELILILLVALWLWVLFPNSKIKRAYKLMEDKSGGGMNRIIRFYNDCLTVESDTNSTEIPYSNICKTIRTKQLLVLVCEDKTGVMLALDGFTIGSAEIVLERINDTNKSTV